MIDTKQFESQIRLEVEKKIKTYLNNLDMSDEINDMIVQVTTEKIDATINQLINIMLKEGHVAKLIDNKLLSSMQEKLDKEIKSRAVGMVSTTDIGTLINERIERFVNAGMTGGNLPDNFIPHRCIDLSGFTVSADDITAGVIDQFSSNGIQDTANQTELSVIDGAVVIENTLITNDSSVQGQAEFKSNVNIAGDLRLQGDLIILNDRFSQQVRSMVDSALQKDREDNALELRGKALLNNGKEVISANALGPGIVTSNLRKVGNLTELNVIGNLQAADTIFADNNKVGINTDSPAGVLTVWDEDAEISLRKYKSKTMYLGSTRDCDLVLGADNKVIMSLRRDGNVGMNKLELGGMKMSSSESIPDYDGTPGELVFMRRPSEDQPWAYQCMGGNRWVALNR